jgi:Glyoxalase/Bleomycin resistance protein/Dioxygenase superfamily
LCQRRLFAGRNDWRSPPSQQFAGYRTNDKRRRGGGREADGRPAAFYEGVFGLKRLKKVEAPKNAISLSDGVMNLTLLHFPEGAKGGKRGPDWAGLHHFGFVVENERATEERIKSYGGEFLMELPNYPGVDAEKKFKDINGIVFDISEHGWS